MTDRSSSGTVGGEVKMSIRHLKKLTQTAETQYAAAVSLEHNPATFGDAVIDISNSLNAQSAKAFQAVKRAFPSAFMDATLGDDPAGIRPLPDDLVHLAGLPGLRIQALSPGSCGAPLVTQFNDTVSFCSSTSLTSQGGVTGNGIGAPKCRTCGDDPSRALPRPSSPLYILSILPKDDDDPGDENENEDQERDDERDITEKSYGSQCQPRRSPGLGAAPARRS